MSGAVVAAVAASFTPAPSGPTRTQIATSDFTGTNGAVPTNFSDLCDGNGQVQINGNAYHSPFANPCDARWNGAGTFTDDQYAKAVVSGFFVGTNGDQIGVIARASADVGATRDMYRCFVSNSDTNVMTLQKVVNGTTTSLGTNSAQAWANGNTIEIECQGTTIRGLRNGVVVISATDSALTTGKPGVYAQVGGNDMLRGDTWEGGNLS